MVHPVLAPSRSRRVILPFVAVVALAGLWTAFWFYAASTADTMLTRWREQEMRFGRTYSCGSQSAGGYPFRIELRCDDAAVEVRAFQPALTIAAKSLMVVAQVYDPTLLVGEVTGPLTVTEAGGPETLVATWQLAQISMRGRPNAPERLSIAADDLRLYRGPEIAGVPLAAANHMELHARVNQGSTPENPAADLVVRVSGATAPAAGGLAAQPLDAEVTAVLRGLKSYAPRPLPVMLRELQAAGGRLDVSTARLAQGETIVQANGSIGLSANGRPDGTLTVTIAGFDKFMASIGGLGKALPAAPAPGRPALSAFDRLAPALGGAGRDQVAAGLLGLLGERTLLDNKPAITMPLRLSDGAATLGPIPLGHVPPLY
ncbi:MAG TPA: DUF2125 domain-containing protein [Xanthobacteraceae bacterium]|nr:DUF2125 domain-containing protein [Xanthobacteraceae bacterium]